jgi:hypothetical protein
MSKHLLGFGVGGDVQRHDMLRLLGAIGGSGIAFDMSPAPYFLGHDPADEAQLQGMVRHMRINKTLEDIAEAWIQLMGGNTTERYGIHLRVEADVGSQMPNLQVLKRCITHPSLPPHPPPRRGAALYIATGMSRAELAGPLWAPLMDILCVPVGWFRCYFKQDFPRHGLSDLQQTFDVISLIDWHILKTSRYFWANSGSGFSANVIAWRSVHNLTSVFYDYDRPAWGHVLEINNRLRLPSLIHRLPPLVTPNATSSVHSRPK